MQISTDRVPQRTKMSDPLNLELNTVVSCWWWILGIELVSSARAIHGLNCRVFSLYPIKNLLKCSKVLKIRSDALCVSLSPLVSPQNDLERCIAGNYSGLVFTM